jgi:hypothetical protein
MKKIKTILIIFLLILAIVLYITFSLIIGNDFLRSYKNKFSPELVYDIKKYIFPYKLISELETKILKQNTYLSLELDYKKNLYSLTRTDFKKIQLDEGLVLKKNKLSGLYYGIDRNYPGTAYLDFYKDKLIIVSPRGTLGFNNINDDTFQFKQIKNNIDSFLSLDKIAIKSSYRGVGVRDIMIDKDIIYLSYIDEISNNCWNVSLLKAKINYQNLTFENFFSTNKCITRPEDKKKEFNANQSGGRIVSFDDNHILLSVGEFRSRALAQDLTSINGKIIKINVSNGKSEIVSIGHRNPQGMVFDRERNAIIVTEHGPAGGDEFNLIDLKAQDSKNYGWPISSYGEHYGAKNLNKKKYLEFPLYKSHAKYNFIEPLKYFTPSIAPSEIIKVGKDFYIASSMKDKSIYFFNLNEKNNITNYKRIEIGERIRDLTYKDNKIYLFLEETSSIGVIDLNLNF